MNEWSLLPGKRYRNLEIAIHVGVWLLFFSWPFAFAHTDIPEFRRFYMRYLISPFLCLCLFYLNYLFLIRRYLFAGKLVRYFLVNLLYIGAAVLLMHFWQKNLMDMLFGRPDYMPPRKAVPVGWLFLFSNFVRFVLVVGFSLAVRFVGRWYRMEMDRQAFEKEKNVMELNNLRKQLHPHFLFNTLNTLYSLVITKSDRAEQAFVQFTEMMKYLYTNTSADFIPLSAEADYIRQYISLQKFRLNEHTKVDFSVTVRDNTAVIAPMLLMTFVENAFKYGVSSHSDSLIAISLVQDGDNIRFNVRNSIFPESLTGKKDGIGLANCRKRLALIYPDTHTLRISDSGDVFEVELTLFRKR